MRILQYPEDQKLLRIPGQIITPEIAATEVFKKHLQEMLQTLREEGDGIGLAATQVGLPYQMFILTVDSNLERIDPQVYLNPKIISQSKAVTKDEEGCLSLIGLRLKVTRPESITWEYQTLDFQTRQETTTGYFTRVILHESDHLMGKLMIDGISSVQRLKVDQWLKSRS